MKMSYDHYPMKKWHPYSTRLWSNFESGGGGIMRVKRARGGGGGGCGRGDPPSHGTLTRVTQASY